MHYELLTTEESKMVEKTINSLLGTEEFSQILYKKKMIKIKHRRVEVYLIDPKDLRLIEKLKSLGEKGILKLIHTRLKLGFFIHKNFLIGIESLAFLAPITHKKIKLTDDDTERFIYGNDVEIDDSILHNQGLKVEDGTIMMVFSFDDIPLGYAKIQTQNKKRRLHNLADIGIYLRSEKSAF